MRGGVGAGGDILSSIALRGHPSTTSRTALRLFGGTSRIFFSYLKVQVGESLRPKCFFPYLKAQVGKVLGNFFLYLMVHVGEKVRIQRNFPYLKVKVGKVLGNIFPYLKVQVGKNLSIFQSNIFGCKSEGILFILLLFILRLFDLFADL